MKQFPHNCCRCGMCCISVTCEIAMGTVQRAQTANVCPKLEMEGINGEGAVCRLFLEALVGSDNSLIKFVFGIGAGCCIKATAKNSDTGLEVPFDELRPEIKKCCSKLAFKNKTGMEPWK